MTEHELFQQVRDRLISSLHLGRFQAGDQLASVREVAAEYEVDHRVVSRVYRELEREGLVEIRKRSGVYVVQQERWGTEMLEETARWAADVVTDAWKRRIRVEELPDKIKRCTASVQLVCACVESVEDLIIAYCAELRDDFGFHSIPVFFDARDVEGRSDSLDPERDLANLIDELRGADLVVTTLFHAHPVRVAAETLGKPLVILRQHPELAASIERQLRNGQLRVVAVDHRFAERMRTMFPHSGGEVRLIRAADPEALRDLDPAEPVLLTRAARERLGNLSFPLLFPHSPSIAPESAHELSEILIRLNLESEQEKRSTRTRR